MDSKCNLLFTQQVKHLWLFLLVTIFISVGCQGKPIQVNHELQSNQLVLDQLEQLENLDNPEGIDDQLWARMTSRFSVDMQDYYLTNGNKLIASAPTSDASQTELTLQGSHLYWGYFNQADYDQNGEVNIADLTPVAMNYGATGPFDVDTALAVVDGDRNTEINLSDITPIAINFRNSTLGGYNIYQSMSPADAPANNSGPNGPGAVLISTLPFTEGNGNTQTVRLQFFFSITSPVIDAYYWVRPTDGEVEGTASNLVRLLPPPNEAPIAIVTATPETGEIPLVVAFDGSASSDMDGTIVDYSWDYDGAVGGLTWVSTGDDPSYQYTYEEVGTFQALLKVTDDAGATTNDVIAIVVSAVPNDPPVADLSADPTSGMGPLNVDFDASLSEDPDGSIVKFEWDWNGDGTYDFHSGATSTTDHLFVIPGAYNATVRITDNADATDTASVVINVTGGTPEWHISTIRNDGVFDGIDLALVNGRPACALSDNNDENPIYYYHANDALGATWPDPIEIGHVDADWLTLELAEGNPAVIYRHDGVFGGFTRAADINGDVWSKETSIEPDYSSYIVTTRWAGAMVDGKPTLGYMGQIDGTDGYYYQSATSVDGTVWNPPSLIYASDQAFFPALHEVNGRPAMIFVDAAGVLNYVRASNTAGTSWPAPTVVVPGSDVYMYPEIATVNGNPAILYPASGGFNSQLNFVRADDVAGATWGEPETIYSNLDFMPFYPSLAVVNGTPAAAWGGANPFDLLYVRANDTDGATWEPGERVDIYFNSPVPLVDVNGYPAIAYLRNGIVSADLMFAIYY